MSDRRPGRPRSEPARAAIMAAARDLLSEVGFERLTMEAIAVRAAVGKQTVYRWWRSKAAVIAEAVLEDVIALPHLTLEDTGDLHHDLRAWLHALIDGVGTPEGEAVIRALAVAVATDATASDALYRRLTGPGHVAIIDRLVAARSSGAIRPDADLVGASDALVGFVLFLVLARQPVTQARADGLLTVVLRGIVTS